MDPALQVALSQGPLAAAELRRRLGVSQPSLSRLLARERREVAVLGRGRASRYGWYRRVRELDPELPVHRVSRAGRAERIGTLLTLAPDRYWFADLERPEASGAHRSLPWFLTDMRPQGFLGRLFPSSHGELELPERVADWSEDQALYALARRGEDCVGNLIVGAESLARWLRPAQVEPVIEWRRRLAEYGRRAQAALQGRAPGSSAAGEQPKFTALVRERAGGVVAVIVKFTPAIDTPAGRRWADLLCAESVAAEVLRAHGHAAAQSHYLAASGRSFLHSDRFDRVGERGRLGLVSLAALDDEFVGERRGWGESAAALRRAGLIDVAAARELRFLAAFGELIANADMHLGNVSFTLDDKRRLRLAPAYDMLPMWYAPTGEGWAQRAPRRGEPRAAFADQWSSAVPLARDYWARLAEDPRLSRGFRGLANRQLRAND
jgi:DNA-binding transcriptional ArsR family regulator